MVGGIVSSAHAAPTIQYFRCRPDPAAAMQCLVTDANKITLEWKISGAGSVFLVYLTPELGFRATSCRPDGSCDTQVALERVGTFSYGLISSDDSGAVAEARTRVDFVPSLAPPTFLPANALQVVDFFAPPARVTLRWEPPVPLPPGDGAYEIGFPNPFVVRTQAKDLTSFDVDGATLRPGRNGFSVRYCQKRSGSKLCSDAAHVTIDRRPAEFTSLKIGSTLYSGATLAYRSFVPVPAAGEQIVASWNAVGQVSSLTLRKPSGEIVTFNGGFQASRSQDLTGLLSTPGLYELDLASCNLFGGPASCSNRSDVVWPGPSRATVQSVKVGVNDAVDDATVVATLTTLENGSTVTRSLKGNALGRVATIVAPGTVLEPGQSAVTILTNGIARLQLVVGSSQTNRTQTFDEYFEAAKLERYPTGAAAPAAPLDVTENQRGVFAIGEYSDTILTGDPSKMPAGSLAGRIAATDAPPVPIFRFDDPGDMLALFIKSSPFTTSLFGSDPARTPITSLGERIIPTGDADGTVFFSQGGGFFSGSGAQNHSRIVRFRPGAPSTDGLPGDDDPRFCAYAVPGDRNQVLGLAWDPVRQRVWAAESRLNLIAPNTFEPGVLSSFRPAELACNNMYDYRTPYTETSPVAPQRYCSTPTETGCFRKYPAPASATGVGQPVFDDMGTPANPDDDVIWFSAVLGSLVRFTIRTGTFTVYPLSRAPGGDPLAQTLGPLPWRIVTTADSVYLMESGDNDLVRLPKARAGDAACQALVNGANPCLSEVQLPIVGHDQFQITQAHTIALDGNNLFFTVTSADLSMVEPDNATIGYVDLPSWLAGRPIVNVISNMSRATSDPRPLRGDPPVETAPLAPASFTGIFVRGVNGRRFFTVADLIRRQILRVPAREPVPPPQ